jgi:hypothetical protein
MTMNTKLLGGLAALVLLCAAAMPVAAATATPGSVEPAAPGETRPAPITSDNGNPAAEPLKKATKAKARKRRYARRHYRHGFYFPVPRFWFHAGGPRYRYHRGHRRYYAGFPLFFRFRW